MVPLGKHGRAGLNSICRDKCFRPRFSSTSPGSSTVRCFAPAAALSHDKSSIFQPRCFLWSRSTDKRDQKKCRCSTEDCVFISGSASLPHTAIHYLSVGQGKSSWGPIVCLLGVLTVCVSVFLAPLLCIQEVSGEPGDGDPGPRGKPRLQGGSVFSCGPCWACWKEPCMQTVGGGGGGRAEEVLGRLLPSRWQDLVNVLLPRVAAQLTHTNLSPVNLLGRLRSQAVSIAGHERFPDVGVGGWGGWKDRGRKGELRGRRRGGWSREGREGAQCETAPAKSLSYMENTSCLQGNRTTSEFLQTKIALMSGDDLSVLWPPSLSARPSRSNSHTRTELMFSRTTLFAEDLKKQHNEEI